MSTDAPVIRRFRPVLQAAVPSADEPLHAEALHQLCLADGLLELLQWSRQGVAADPLACMWLGSLRWHLLMTGSTPDGAPDPPPREADALLAESFGPGGSARTVLAGGSGESSLAGLSSGEMGYPADPVQPEADDAEALLRVVPVALVPYIEDRMRLDWAEQAVCLTHGDAQLRRRARKLAALVFDVASGRREHQDEDLGSVLDDSDELTAALISRQVRAAASVAADAAFDGDPEADAEEHAEPAAEAHAEPDDGAGVAADPWATAQTSLQRTIRQLGAQWVEVTAPGS